MSFRDFTFPQVCTDLGLDFDEARLFSHVAPVAIDSTTKQSLELGRSISSRIGNEKARSEFVIAPFLLNLHILSGRSFGLFSGTELNVDAKRGLDGECDFLLSREPLMYMLKAPLVAVATAKNDNVNNGFAQCIATMKAIELFNLSKDTPAETIYGVSTTGVAWKFFELQNDNLTLDSDNYDFSDLDKVAGIILQIVSTK
jgi:hypothetical protein